MQTRLVLYVPFLALALVACTPDPGGGPGGGGGTGGTAATAGTFAGTGAGGTFGGTGGIGAIGGVGGISGVGGGGGSCKPGHYVGEFTGTYRSVAWGNGADEAALTVNGAADVFTGKPGLEFWLESTGRVCDPSDEFCGGFTLHGGQMRGNADPFGGGAFLVPFEIDLTGELDCGRGVFRGQLENGRYEVGPMNYAYFAGEITANYDQPSSAFIDGMWNVIEEPPAPGATPFPPGANIGGDGTWNAQWADDLPAPTMP
jgi:hypothetical protein